MTRDEIYREIQNIRREEDLLIEKLQSNNITQEEFHQEWGRLGNDILFYRRQLDKITNTNN